MHLHQMNVSTYFQLLICLIEYMQTFSNMHVGKDAYIRTCTLFQTKKEQKKTQGFSHCSLLHANRQKLFIFCFESGLITFQHAILDIFAGLGVDRVHNIFEFSLG